MIFGKDWLTVIESIGTAILAFWGVFLAGFLGVRDGVFVFGMGEGGEVGVMWLYSMAF